MARFLLRKGANVNAAARKNGGRTALQAAATIGNNDLVQILLDEGDDVNAPPAFIEGRTAIQAAAQGRHTEILRTLKEHRADLNAKAGTFRGRTCLQAAAENVDSEMIHALLKLVAEVNSPVGDERGKTALQVAIQSNDSASIHLLLNWGADINAAPSPVKGLSALYGAIRHNDLTLTRRLLKVANPNGATSRHPPVVKAARVRSFDLVQSLIEAGADVNALGDKQETSQYALQAAVISSNIEILRLLLTTHAHINTSTADFASTPLELAVKKICRDMVQLLLEKGAVVDPTPNVEIPDYTLLSQAVFNCGNDSVLSVIIEDLITAGANVNRGSKKFGLPLTAAVKYFPLAKRLPDAGANLNGQWPGRPNVL
jgi:ankyrin repeat protein